MNMKKYLKTVAFAVVFGGLLTSCSHDDIDLSDYVEKKMDTYEKAFHDAFGPIDPNQDWGFGSSNALTRSAEADPRGEWWARSVAGGGDGLIVPYPLTDNQKDKVRRYFQQHKNPGGTDCEDMSSYFVQHVYTGGTNVDDNSQSPEKYWTTSVQLENGSAHMDEYVAGSMHLHVNNFNATTATSISVWDGISYQDGYPTGNESEDYNHKVCHNDQIMLMKDVNTDCFGWYNSNASLEVNNHYRLVSGDVIQQWDPSLNGKDGKTADVSGMLFVGFDFESQTDPSVIYRTEDADNPGLYYWDGNPNMGHYREARTGDNEEDIAYFKNYVGGNNKQYYLGCADGYYSDWIVRITKAVSREDTPTNRTVTVIERQTTTGQYKRVEKGEYDLIELPVCKRIICEDLGQVARADIDFNDAVFDVFTVRTSHHSVINTYYDDVLNSSESSDVEVSSEKFTDIRLLAAGGTIPLTVAGEDVHDKFNVGISTMVNTVSDESSISGAPYTELNRSVTFRSRTIYDNAIDVPIYVRYNNNVLELSSKVGDAPHKIAVPVGTPWATERTSIADAFGGFITWVNNKGTTPWNNPTSANIYPWNETDIPYNTGQTWTREMYTDYAGYVGSSTVNVEHPVTITSAPGSGETSVFNNNLGVQLINGTEGNVSVQASSFSNVAEGTVLRIYGGAYGNWNISALGTRFSSYKSGTDYIEITLTASQAAALKTSGLNITGTLFTVTDVTIANVSEQSSGDTFNFTPSSSETQLWSGTKAIDWGENAITVDASSATTNSSIRIYGVGAEGWQLKVYSVKSDWSWEELNISGWASSDNNNSCIMNASSDNGSLTSNGYVTISVSTTVAAALASGQNKLVVSGDKFTLKYVTIQTASGGGTEEDTHENPNSQIEGILLWGEGPLDFGNHHILALGKDVLKNANATGGDKIRFYLESSAIKYGQSEKQWKMSIFTGYEQGWTLNTPSANGNDTSIANGYFEITLTQDDADVLTMRKDMGYSVNTSLKIQGYRFILHYITLIKQ